MTVGRMDRKLTFQSRSSLTSGKSNEIKDVWTDFTTVWGEYLPSRGYNKDQGDQPINVGEDVFRIWYTEKTAQITHDMRVVYNSENKKITSIEEFGRRNKLIIRTQRLN